MYTAKVAVYSSPHPEPFFRLHPDNRVIDYVKVETVQQLESSKRSSTLCL